MGFIFSEKPAKIRPVPDQWFIYVPHRHFASLVCSVICECAAYRVNTQISRCPVGI